MRIHSHHERRIDTPINRVGPLLDTLSSDDDLLWPRERWPAMRFDRPLEVGADGGHGFVRYRVAEYEGGRRIRFEITGPPGFSGHHEFRITQTGDGSLLAHIIDGRSTWRFTLPWLVAVRWLHDALIEDAFDKAEMELGTLGEPRRWSRWVRLLRWAARRRR